VPGEKSIGVYRFRCQCLKAGQPYTIECTGLVSRNAKPGEPPWRITFFNAQGEPKVHFCYDDPDGWKREDPLWLLERLQDYMDMHIESVDQIGFEPHEHPARQ
jgi:hypothetical protein